MLPRDPRYSNWSRQLIQNFGSTLNVHPHFHLVVTDGVFSIGGEQLLFHEAILLWMMLRMPSTRTGSTSH
ncbi:MAG: transposase [Nitrosopumilus sp.]|nr:transposase [Nitrosopumilus sp.]